MIKTLRKVVILTMMATALLTSNRLDAYGEDDAETCFAGQCYLQSTLATIGWGWLIAGPIVIGAIIALSLANHHHHENQH